MIFPGLLPFLPRWWVAGGSVLSISWYLWSLFPHQLLIKDSEVPFAFEKVQKLLWRFKELSRNGNMVTYGGKEPEWLIWREGNVELTCLPTGALLGGHPGN
jgi:hypothetical protein